MDFFEYASLVDAFIDTDRLWVSLLVGGLCFAIVYIFQGVGLFIIATRGRFPHKWMAFVPFLNAYYIGVCTDNKNRFMGINTRTVGIVAAAAEGVLFCGFVLYYVAAALAYPYLEVLARRDEEILGVTQTIEEWGLPETFSADHPTLAWAGWCYNYLYAYILRWIDLVYQFLLIVLLNCFFQTYAPRHYFLFTITSIIFPIQGVLIFSVRNARGMPYSEYVRRMQERAYMQYRRQNYDPYNGGYNTAGPQGDRPDQPQRPAEDPFGGLGGDQDGQSGSGDGGDPFDDFKN